MGAFFVDERAQGLDRFHHLSLILSVRQQSELPMPWGSLVPTVAGGRGRRQGRGDGGYHLAA